MRMALTERAVITWPFTIMTTAIKRDSTDAANVFYIFIIVSLTVSLIALQIPTPDGYGVIIFDSHFHHASGGYCPKLKAR